MGLSGDESTKINVCGTSGCRVRILVVENEERFRRDFDVNLRRWDYEPIIAEGVGEALVQDALKKAGHYRCHLALVDMRLKDDHDVSDTSGLDLVPELKPTESIIVSAFGDRKTAVAALKDKGALDFVGKEDGPRALREAIEKNLRIHVCPCTERAIRWPSGLSSENVIRLIYPYDPEIPLDEIDCILRRLFREDRGKVELDYLSSDARTPSFSPRPRSIVLKAELPNRLPFVVKLARKKRIDQEFERYNKYVHEKLSQGFYAQVRNKVSLWDLGGIVYHFMGTRVRGFQTFSKFYVEASPQEVNEVLTHLFNVWGRLYDQYRSLLDVPLFEGYNQLWGGDAVDEDPTDAYNWLHHLKSYPWQSQYLNIQLSPNLSPSPLINPVHWIQSKKKWSRLAKTHQTVVHGDMLGDNIFVDPDNRTWAIDYERTGPGPIFADFVELEVDILTHLAQFETPTDFEQYVQMIVAAYQPLAHPLDLSNPRLLANYELLSGKHAEVHEETRKALSVVEGLRQLASSIAPQDEDPRSYFWGILLNAVFRALIRRRQINQIEATGEKSRESTAALKREETRALVLGGIVCQLLENWESATNPRK